nr:MAG TPA: hypothetical protein [Caudoviricetes sp.]
MFLIISESRRSLTRLWRLFGCRIICVALHSTA